MGPKSAPKPDEAKPKMPESVPANKHKAIPIDFEPVSGCFNHNPKLVNCEIAQPSLVLLQPHRLNSCARTLCYAMVIPGRKSGVRAGFRPDALRPAFGRPGNRF